MSRTSLDYRKQLQSLLPKGKIWNRTENSVLTKLLWGLAEELARIDNRVLNLIEEKFLDSADELITEHEYDFGIPEEGKELQITLELRRNELKGKLLQIGQQDKQYFIELCNKIGYNVSIEEFRPAWCGIVVSGEPCGDQENLFYWKINIDKNSITEQIKVNLNNLINRINRVKPAHTHFLIDFYNASFSRAFNIDFNRIPYYDNFWFNNEFNCCFDNNFCNNKDYYGTNYKGAFNYRFSLDFNRNSGGAFNEDFNKIEFTHPE